MNHKIMISLIFTQDNGKKFIIPASFRDKGSDIIKKYKKISKESDRNNIFLFCGKELNTNISILDQEIKEFSSITVLKPQEIYGSGIGLNFIDVSKNKIKELESSEYGPSYRRAYKGINLFGICQFKKCLAFNKEVVIPIQEINLI